MFTSTFYNAGYTISSMNDFLPFLESIPHRKYPDFLIIALDQWMFNEHSDNLKNVRSPKYWSNSYIKYPEMPILKSIYSDFFKGKLVIPYSKFKIAENSNIDKIGLGAFLNNTGIRNDGSRYYALQINKLLNGDKLAKDYLFSDTKNRIRNGFWPFKYGSKINEKAINKLNQFLQVCEENEIFVIAFLPPFANSVYEEMNKSGDYTYIKEIFPRLQPLFKRYNFEIYDYSSVSYCKSNDEEMLDGFHGGEVTYLKILMDMVKQNSKLRNITNIDKLKRDLNKAPNSFIVYDN